ncbi:MAG: VapB-type antitoxin [Candidatus Bathyarchaeia archaeon]
MTQTSTIAVRIKKEIKETLEKAGVNISETVRKHLEELFWKIRLKEETETMKKILEKVKPSEKGFAEKSVREDRESH